MTEKLSINGKEIWVVVEPHLVPRENPHIIPSEYFTAMYYRQEPGDGIAGELFIDGIEPRLFESPVAALEYAREMLSELI
ncbi:hypothetical protein [Paraflavitalea speifideaquila]|uniref:hypothetical protein n=1 Tax=Paraflavitalea speifideaquila TaxID=3076558 RepID=UPI0028E5FBA7|nr:hypothetical protein [Paraflavitalea speifideiaquila]